MKDDGYKELAGHLAGGSKRRRQASLRASVGSARALSPIERMIDAATGYTDEPERPRDPTPEQRETAKLLASDVLSDLRQYYPDVVKTRPTTWPIHLRNTIANKVAHLLSEQNK